MASHFNLFLSPALTQRPRAMMHDERVYPEPFTFKPERFLDESGGLNDDDRILAYGFGRRYLLSFAIVHLFSQGRRICVGKHVASAFISNRQIFPGAELTPFEQLWLTFTSILATLNIEKVRDKSGKEMAIHDDYEDFGFIK